MRLSARRAKSLPLPVSRLDPRRPGCYDYGVPRSSSTTRPKATAQNAKAQAKAQARAQSKALVSRLTDAGEEALQRIADLPGGQRALGAVNDLRTRVDELGKKVRGIDELERRIARLEKQVAELKAPRRTSASRTPTRRASS
jgi:hypothetical protein